jgi:hypothetical protein
MSSIAIPQLEGRGSAALLRNFAPKLHIAIAVFSAVHNFKSSLFDEMLLHTCIFALNAIDCRDVEMRNWIRI